MADREAPTHTPDLDLENVRDFLVDNPDFVREDAELFALMMRPDDRTDVIDLGSRAREKLGYDPRTAVRDGLERFVEWYRGRE